MYSNFNDISNIYRILEKLTSHSLSFQELINISRGSGTFSDMLSSTTFFEFLQKYDKLTTQNLRDLFDNIITSQELTAFNFNSFLFNKPLESKAVQLAEYLKKYESIRDNNGVDHILMLLNFDHEKAFDDLMRRRILSIRNLRVLIEYLKKDAIAIHFIRYNRKIFGRLLKNFIFTAQDIFVLDYQLRKAAPTSASSSHFTKFAKHKLFLFELLDAVFTQNSYEKNFVYLNNLKKDLWLYEVVYSFSSFSTQSRRELFRLIKNSESAQSISKQIVDNNLQDQYDFESLKELLTKDNNKKKIKLNF